VSSSRVTRDGRVIVTSGEDAGRRYIVLCDTDVGFEPRGRPPTETEQASTRAPYQAVSWAKVSGREPSNEPSPADLENSAA
jgi:hypothetical protein